MTQSAQMAKWRRVSDWAVATTATLTVLLLALFFARESRVKVNEFKVTDEEISKFTQELMQLRDRALTQQRELQTVSSHVEAITSSKEPSPLDAQIATLRADIKSVGLRITDLEKAISDNPTKSLAVPLLKQDLENVKVNLQREIESNNRQIDRIYDQNKWFIGLMVTVAIGFISLVITHFVQGRKA